MVSKIKTLFLLMVLSASAKTFAEPMVINFNDMIKQSKTIVIGTYLGFNGKTAYESSKYYFKVFQTLKGETTTDTLVLNRAESGSVNLAVGTNCVAFINIKNGFEWVGTSEYVNPTIDNTILFMEGFYDWNAYIVGPATISIGQLKEYLKNNSYTGSIYGDLHFFTEVTKKMEPFPIPIEIKYTYRENVITPEITIGGIDLNDFKKKPTFNLPYWDNIIEIVYESNLYRPLEIHGEILNDATSPNRYHAMFWVYAPEELRYKEFIDYLSNASYGHSYYELEVTTAHTTYTLLLNEEIGAGGHLLNYKGKTLSMMGLSLAPEREITFGSYPNEMIIVMDSSLVTSDDLKYASEDFVAELKFGPVAGKMYNKQNGKKEFIENCIISYKDTRFAKNPNYK